MDDDWASDGEEPGFGDISALPDLPPPPSPPPPPPSASAPELSVDNKPASRFPSLAAKQSPPPNAWATPGGRVRSAGPQAVAPGHHPHAHHHHRHNPPPRSRPSGPVALQVSNLPIDTQESDLAAFFSRAGVNPAEIKLQRQQNNQRAMTAIVVLRPDVAPALALALNGRPFKSRTVSIRIQSNHDRPGDHGPSASMGSIGMASPATSMDSMSAPGSYAGAPPARKKLQLKPRTKPLPVLKVDARAVDGPRAGHSAPPPATAGATAKTPTSPTVPPSGPPRGSRRPAHHRGGGGGRGAGRSSDRMRMPRGGSSSGSGGDRMNTAAFDSLAEAPSAGSSFGGSGTGGAPGNRVPQSAPPPSGPPSQGTATDAVGGTANAGSAKVTSTNVASANVGGANRVNGGAWRGGSNMSTDVGGAWTSARESGNKSTPVQNRDSSAKKDEEQKRPALLNAFAALEVNDGES